MTVVCDKTDLKCSRRRKCDEKKCGHVSCHHWYPDYYQHIQGGKVITTEVYERWLEQPVGQYSELL